MLPNEESIVLIQALWDELVDFDLAAPDRALDHLASSLCTLVDAQNASWVNAVRLPDVAPGDPVHGWRPWGRSSLRPTPTFEQGAQEQWKMLEAGHADITTIRNVALAGRYRANRLIDLVDSDWFDSAYYRRFYLDRGYADAIWAGCPINKDVEVYIGLYRGLEQPRFEVTERDLVAFCLHGLKWFFRQHPPSHGHLAADSPLTSVERSVLQGLLAGQTEKGVASALGQSVHTTHDHVKRIYRELGVANRAALMALWPGRMV